MRPTSEISHNLSQLVDKKLGELYLVIENVNENLAEIRHVSHYMESLFDIHTNLADLIKLSTQDDALNFTSDNLTDLATFYANLNTLITNRASLDALADEIQANADIAAKWAGEAEDTEVTPGLYSAMHHALKAAATHAAVQAIKDSAETSVQAIADAAETYRNEAETFRDETSSLITSVGSTISRNIRNRTKRLIICSGQSNGLGNNFGGDTPINNNVFIWDDVTNTSSVAELGNAPFRVTGENNMFLQAARHAQLVEGDDVEYHMVMNAQGGLAINYWLNEDFIITNITNTNPAVVTYIGNPKVLNNNSIVISDVVGMTEVNGNTYSVHSTNHNESTFVLDGVDATGFSSYTSGGKFNFAIDKLDEINTQITAMISSLSLDSSTKVDGMLFMQGESDDAYSDGFEYRDSLRKLVKRLETYSWWGKQSKLISGLVAENMTGDKANLGIRQYANSGENLNFAAVDTSFLETSDTVHFTGSALTEAGKRFGDTFLAMETPHIWLPHKTIDRFVNMDLSSEFQNELPRFYEYINDWDFRSEGQVTLLMTEDTVVDRIIRLYGINGDRILLQGSFDNSKTIPPVYSDFTGTLITDLDMVRNFYKANIIASGVTPFITSGGYKLRMSTLSIIGDQTNSALGIDGRDQSNRIGKSSIGIEYVTIAGFQGTRGYGIRLNDGSLKELSTKQNVFAHNVTGIYAENSNLDLNALLTCYNTGNGVYMREGGFGNLQNIEAKNNTGRGFYAEAGSRGSVKDGDFASNGVDIRADDISEVLTEGASYTTTIPSAYDTPEGFEVLRGTNSKTEDFTPTLDASTGVTYIEQYGKVTTETGPMVWVEVFIDASAIGNDGSGVQINIPKFITELDMISFNWLPTKCSGLEAGINLNEHYLVSNGNNEVQIVDKNGVVVSYTNFFSAGGSAGSIGFILQYRK